jgi:hypothetical protein
VFSDSKQREGAHGTKEHGTRQLGSRADRRCGSRGSDPGASDSSWFLSAIGLGLLCIYLVALNFETSGRLEAVCEVAMSQEALSLCLQYGSR